MKTAPISINQLRQAALRAATGAPELDAVRAYRLVPRLTVRPAAILEAHSPRRVPSLFSQVKGGAS